MNFSDGISIEEARRFLLLKQGLLGRRIFRDARGAFAYVAQAGCIQFDPVDICGRNADLTLLSRVDGYSKETLDGLLYRERALVEWFDKNLSIMPAGDWKYFERERARHRARERSLTDIAAVEERVLGEVASRGPLCAADLDLEDRVDWYWSDTRLARAALEHLYFTGALCVHHRRGAVRYFDLAGNCLSPAERAADPLPDDRAHVKWRALRRIGAVGLLWNRASDAWLCVDGLSSAAGRGIAFGELSEECLILPVRVEGLRDPLYLLKEDAPILARACGNEKPAARCELVAPLDPLLWDRKLVRALFGFSYAWEIYTPKEKRLYGCYTLPVLYRTRFVGRLDAAADRARAALVVRGLWLEADVRRTRALERGIASALKRLARFNGCASIETNGFLPEITAKEGSRDEEEP